MDRFRTWFIPRKRDDIGYEPLTDDGTGSVEESVAVVGGEGEPFSWVEYLIFALLGIAMLWAWNMFLAAAPYFQTRFSSDAWILENSQSAVLTVFTVTNLAAVLVLTAKQRSASYTFRVTSGLAINVAIFALLSLTTKWFLRIFAAPAAYFAFLLVLVAAAAWATGLAQNGAFALAVGFGRPEYIQAIMAGQGIAGVLPPVAQIVSVLLAPPGSSDPSSPSTGRGSGGGGRPFPRIESTGQPRLPSHEEAGTATLIYFLTAVAISLGALAGFVRLLRLHNRRLLALEAAAAAADEGLPRITPARRHVGMLTLLRKLHWPAAAVFSCFSLTMFFPVFTTKILSVHDDGGGGGNIFFTPPVFVPLGFLVWNLGDLAGRMATALPAATRPLVRHPALLFVAVVARCLLLPLYGLCNIHGRGAVVASDAFYLLAVQFPFGLTNGWLGSAAMMAGGKWVDEGEREAAGGFMSLCLVGGLTFGSVLSFSAAGV